MNTPTKIVLYVALGVAAYFFGTRFYRDYQRSQTAAQPSYLSDDPMDVDLPSYDLPPDSTESPSNEAAPDPDSAVPVPDQDTATGSSGPPNSTDSASSTEPPLTTTEGTATEEETLPPPRLGFYGGGFCLLMLCLGLLIAIDFTQFLGRGAVGSLFNEDGVGTMDDEYEAAEEQWQQGDYLEAIRMMREYLAKNPREVHAALRIAEIYEKDLSNPLASALEYEEILQTKLSRERWGWAAIHLANLYSGPLEKPDQAVALLRRLDDEYGDTQAAEKARRRLAMLDGDGEAPTDSEEA